MYYCACHIIFTCLECMKRTPQVTFSCIVLLLNLIDRFYPIYFIYYFIVVQIIDTIFTSHDIVFPIPQKSFLRPTEKNITKFYICPYYKIRYCSSNRQWGIYKNISNINEVVLLNYLDYSTFIIDVQFMIKKPNMSQRSHWTNYDYLFFSVWSENWLN